MLPLWSSAAVLLAASLLAADEPAPPPSEPPRLTLRLRDVALREIVFVHHELAGQDWVVDADVVGRADVDMTDVTPEEVERALAGAGLVLSEPGRMRRVSSSGSAALPALRGTGHPVSLDFRRPGDMRDVLRLFGDILGEKILVPAGALGDVVVFVNEHPVDDVFRAVLASARLDQRRQGDRIAVFRTGEPDAVLLPAASTTRRAGHVAYREGEGGPAKRSMGAQGLLISEVSLTGLVASGTSWAALMLDPYSSGITVMARGQRFYDGVLESIDGERIVMRREDGTRRELVLPSAPPGLTRRADDAASVVERARARMAWRDFDEGERLLRTALARGPAEGEAKVLRAGLADLLYARAQSLLDVHETERALRPLEEAYELDALDRPWQAGEDLNEIGFAWTALGEPEKAEPFHRRALEISRTEEAHQEPRRTTCMREHPRADWSAAAALDGLANAERVRGRLEEAGRLYEEALEAWKDAAAFGPSAALTGLGLVRHGQGRYQEALELHQRALTHLAEDPVARAAVLANVGSAQLALGRRDAARATWDQSLALYRDLRDRAGEGTVLNNLGALWESAKDRAQACASYEQAMAASREADDRRGEAITRRQLQRMVDAGAASDAALERCRAALASDRAIR
jgi:tetratricopeptide (TPR) repeat protein